MGYVWLWLYVSIITFNCLEDSAMKTYTEIFEELKIALSLADNKLSKAFLINDLEVLQAKIKANGCNSIYCNDKRVYYEPCPTCQSLIKKIEELLK